MDSHSNASRIFSLEFFPPRNTEAEAAFNAHLHRLIPLRPRFCSVTFGAAGSTRDKTLETVLLLKEKGLEAAPHLSCIASTRENLSELIHAYREAGIRRIVALRGDIPSGMLSFGEFRHASELVAFIREETGDHFHIEVAAYPEMHPQAPNLATDIQHFKRKVEAGANSAITQYFFNPDAYFRFVEDCEKAGIKVPIVPGIMPITNSAQITRFSDMCGADIPRWIRKRLEGFGDNRTAIRAFGVEIISNLCSRLLEGGAPGLHFYTLNQSEAILTIWENLGLGDQPENI